MCFFWLVSERGQDCQVLQRRDDLPARAVSQDAGQPSRLARLCCLTAVGCLLLGACSGKAFAYVRLWKRSVLNTALKPFLWRLRLALLPGLERL